MLYPLLLQTLANEQLEETRRHAEHLRRVREIRAGNRPPSKSRRTLRYPRLVTLRVAGLATRSPR
jgi:hypothetical protein